MTSQESSSSIFSSDSMPIYDIDEGDVDVIWKTLFDSLPSVSTITDMENVLVTVKSSLRSYLKYVSVDEVQTKLLQYVGPIVSQLCQKNLEQIKGITETLREENLEPIKKHLQISVDILNIMADAVAHIISWDKVDVMQIESLPKTVANILLQSYKHCKESETVYGSLFSNLIAELTSVFRKTSELNFQFFLLLNSVLIYEDIEGVAILTEVLNILALIGEIVVSLDLKTMAEHWKGFMKLLQQNASNLQTGFDIERPVKFLAGNVENILKEVTNSKITDSKMISRPLKEGSFELKLIIKLCESFPAKVGACVSKLIDLLIILHEYSAPSLNSKNVPLDMIDLIESHLIIGSEPIFLIAFKNQSFLKNYFEKYDSVIQGDHSKVGFIFLTTSILKNFTKMSVQDKQIWLAESDRNIFKIIFHLISNCHPELCSDFKIPIRSDTGDAPTIVDLYEFILTHSAAAALTLNAVEFQILEMILFESVLQTNIWRAFLAVDLWCILGRYGTSDLCYNQLKFLSNSYNRCTHSSNYNLYCPEILFLSLLIYRLFPLLSVTHQLQFYELYPVLEHVQLWRAIGFEKMPKSVIMTMYQVVVEKCLQGIDTFLNEQGDTRNVDEFLLMCNLLQLISTIPETSILFNNNNNNNNSLINRIISLWENLNILTIVETTSDNYVNTKSMERMIEYYFQSLCQITSTLVITKCSNSDHIFLILKSTIDILDIEHKTSNIKLSILKILNTLATLRLSTNQNKENILSIISKLFAKLLTDTNPFIKQLTYEIFNYFAHTTPYETIVRQTVSVDQTLQQEFVNYVQKIPLQTDTTMDFKEYVKHQQRNVPPEQIAPIEKDLEIEPVTKKLKIDPNSIVNRILADVETLLNITGSITVDNQMKIRKIIDNLSTIV